MTKRKMLSYDDIDNIDELMDFLASQNKKPLAIWALDYSERVILPIWQEYYPEDKRPQNAIIAARKWLDGKIKLPLAKPEILSCHRAAREAGDNPAAEAAARAIGQSASTIHSARHAAGLYFYGALALAYHNLGADAKWSKIEKYASNECRLMYEALKKIAKDLP